MSASLPSQPRPRCSHPSLDALTARLLDEFVDVGPAAVAREVARAVAAAEFTGLARADDFVLMVELVARAQLELATGRREDAARLDPQQHPLRATLELR